MRLHLCTVSGGGFRACGFRLRGLWLRRLSARRRARWPRLRLAKRKLRWWRLAGDGSYNGHVNRLVIFHCNWKWWMNAVRINMRLLIALLIGAAVWMEAGCSDGSRKGA